MTALFTKGTECYVSHTSKAEAITANRVFEYQGWSGERGHLFRRDGAPADVVICFKYFCLVAGTMPPEQKLLDGFIEFVNNQDPEREIDHSGWSSCAVGEYFLYKGLGRPDTEELMFLDLLGGEDRYTLGNYLNEANEWKELATYAGLQALIANLQEY